MTQLILGTQFRACAGVYTQGGRMRSLWCEGKVVKVYTPKIELSVSQV